MNANISLADFSSLAEVFHLLGQPNRIKILLVIGGDAACVCHIEAVLGIRQATISQHLKALRESGLVTTQREGRNIFYRLADPDLHKMILDAAQLASVPEAELEGMSRKPVPNCPCPYCNPGMDPELSCKKIRKP